MSRAASVDESNLHHKTMVQTPFSYETLCGRFEAAVGRLDAAAVRLLEEDAAPWPEVEATMREMAGESGLLQFAVFDQGAVASLSGAQVYCRLYRPQGVGPASDKSMIQGSVSVRVTSNHIPSLAGQGRNWKAAAANRTWVGGRPIGSSGWAVTAKEIGYDADD